MSSSTSRQVRTPGLTNDSLTKLRQYVKELPHDSYSIHNYRYSSDKPEKLFEVAEKHGKFLVSLCPLVGLPKAIKEAPRGEFELLSADVDVAKEHIAEKVLKKLEQTVDPPDVIRKGSKDNHKLNLAGKGGYWVRPILLKDPRERFQLKWPDEAPVSLFIVEEEDEEGTWGLLTTSPAEHNYQLCIGNKKLRLEVSSDNEKIDWKPEELDNVLKFHHQALCREGNEHQLDELLYVKVRDRRIDYEAMKEPPTDPPDWLPELLRQMDRLSFWELVSTKAPVEPAPNPLKLQKIFDEPDAASQKEEFANDVLCMVKVGKNTLRLAAAVAESARDSNQTRECLNRRVEEYLDRHDPQRMADLLIKTGLIDLGTRKKIGSTREVCEMFYALLGAHKLESDVFSVLRLWEWFIALSNQDLGSADKYKGLEETARDYVAACPRYLGRTPSYIEFGEMDPDECDKDVPGPYLRVRFEESDDGIYRWRENIAEEKRPEINPDDWRRLPYDYLSGTFCSPSMKISGPGADRYRPLPNKLCAWLRGRCAQKLVSIKHSIEQTPPYYFLREEEQEETDEKGSVVMVTYLYVWYKTLQGEVYYRRSTKGGGLGEEYYQGKKYILSYSESKKTLVSGVMAGWACPRKVVTWLLENRSLSDLIPGRRKGRKGGNDYYESKVTTLEDGRAEFYQKGETVTVKAMPIKAPGGGFIYQYSTDDCRTWQALSYAEERKEWVRNASSTNLKSDDDGIPCEAIMAITPSEEASAGMASSLKTPTSVKLLFPSATGTALAEIEQQTDHRFKRPQYLAEALTHYSAQSRAVRSNGHLALVGEIVLEHYVSDKVVKEAAMFFGSHLVVGHKEGQPLAKTFATPKGLPPPRAPAPTEENRGGVDNVIALDRRIWVCCNHVSYAARSILTELHESMNKDSRELEEAINRFAKEFKKLSQPKDQRERNVKWQQLFKSGAPKALGDVFLAVIGAITMDSDYFEAEQLMLQHYQDSEQIFELMKNREVPAGIPNHTLMSTNGLRQLREDFPQVHCEKVLEADTPQQHSLSKELQGGLDMDAWFHVNDLCMVEVEEGSSSKEVIGSTPRSLLIHLGLEKDPGSSEGSDMDRKSESIPEDAQQSDMDKNKPTEHDGAIYCKHCQMWLNGPAQWADHEIGKKHRKAVRRQQVERYSGKFPDFTVSEKIPAPPEGFGKRTYEKGIDEDPPDDMQADRDSISQVEGSAQSEQLDFEDQRFGDTEHDAAIYCKYCQMWLNGPTQWADHEIGKKHQKAVRRAAGTGSAEPMDFDQSQDSYSWQQQRYDDGYGWKPQLMQQQMMGSSYSAYAVPGPPPYDSASASNMDLQLQ